MTKEELEAKVTKKQNLINALDVMLVGLRPSHQNNIIVTIQAIL